MSALPAEADTMHPLPRRLVPPTCGLQYSSLVGVLFVPCLASSAPLRKAAPGPLHIRSGRPLMPFRHDYVAACIRRHVQGKDWFAVGDSPLLTCPERVIHFAVYTRSRRLVSPLRPGMLGWDILAEESSDIVFAYAQTRNSAKLSSVHHHTH